MAAWCVLAGLVVASAAAVEPLDPGAAPAGTRGVVLTEMAGGEIVEVPLTVLGTLGATAPEGEIVLVRLDDPRFETTGIAAGMSGSPVYVDGKLLGALALGWAFAREPIGGVTPFTRMQSLADAPRPSPSLPRLARCRSPSSWSRRGRERSPIGFSTGCCRARARAFPTFPWSCPRPR